MLSSNVVVVVCLLLFTVFYIYVVYKRTGSSVTLSHLFCIYLHCSICQSVLWPVEGMVASLSSGRPGTRALSMEVQEPDRDPRARLVSQVRSGERRSARSVWASAVRSQGR